MDVPTGLPIPQEDWERTPISVQVVIIAQIAKLQEQIARLEVEVARLREQVNKNSQNSSKPPSSDGPQTPSRPKAEPTGRKAGGQKGHHGHGRKLKPPDQVQRTVVCKPDSCHQCGALLLGEDPQPRRHQVSELPKIEPVVTEYQLHTLTCLACGAETSGGWPEEMPEGSFGPRTQAMVGYLGRRFGMSDRDVAELMAVGFHTEIGLGTIPAQEQAVSAAMKVAVEEAKAYARAQVIVNMDETGWHEKGKPDWLWVGATSLVTVFLLLATRGAAGMQRLLGDDFAGILGSDRWTAYNGFDPLRRQVCWAHLKLDFQALFERGGESRVIGKLLLKQTQLLFSAWRRLREGTLGRTEFSILVKPIRQEIKALLQLGLWLNQSTTRKTCTNILKLEPAIWTFVAHEGIEPTNNTAERPLRRGVL
jgi:transposase